MAGRRDAQFTGVAAPHSKRGFSARVEPEGVWRLSESPKECTPHAVGIGEARLLRDRIDRMPTLLDHEPGGLQAQILHGLCRRLAGLLLERSTELPRTEMRYPGK